MKTRELDNLLSSLGPLANRGEPFTYQRDDYARRLLGWSLREPQKISDLKRGRFARLLKKSSTRAALASASRGWLCAEALTPRKPGVDYVLTLGRWGDPEGDHDDYQLTRPGENLVVQVNFPDFHDSEYRRLVDPKGEKPFGMDDHPIHKERVTMAWARIDLDLGRGEALIEEIQNDWIREVTSAYSEALTSDEGWVEYDDLTMLRRGLLEYFESVLRPHARQWAELTLCAALWVLFERLGISTVFFHTFEGSRLKGESCEPPRSLYTDLPRKFCFERTNRAPSYLAWKDSPVLKQSLGPGAKTPVDWFRLELG